MNFGTARLLIFTTLMLLAGGAAQAQVALTVSPDTLRYPSVREVLLVNTGTTSLRIDSLGVSRFPAHFWAIDVTTPDSSFKVGLDSYERPVQITDLLLDPEESIRFFFAAYDPCIVCKAGIVADDSKVVDTLFIYASDPAGTTASASHRVYLDISTFVSDEEAPVAPKATVEVFPNPFTGEVRVRLGGIASISWHLTVYDLLGRRVLEREVRGPGEHALSLPPSLVPGHYVLHVRDGERLVAQQHLIKL